MHLRYYFSLIKFSHTIFAIPFAAVGFAIAVLHHSYTFDFSLLLYVLLCMFFARTSAMAFNRFSDYKIDKKNERTASREIPSGKISPKTGLTISIISGLLFILTTWFINPLCFYLSPIALITILGYSLTKRFTFLCHFILGIGLALSPIGAYIAVSGKFHIIPLLFSFIVFTWTGGFDILYALQDEEFDRTENLHSIPAKFGRNTALKISIGSHFFSILFVLIAGIIGNFNGVYWIGACFFTALLLYQHTLVKPHDISKINLAFGTTNGIAGVVFGTTTILSFAL